MNESPESRRWAQVEAIFDRAIELEGLEREALLDEACPDDPDLRQEVEVLLRAAESAGPLDHALGELAPAVTEEATVPVGGTAIAAGRRIGPWRIIEPIGSGGMGRVFLAERAEGGFEQRVALKVLRWEVASPRLIDRFRTEQQILAQLEHPSIARLIDGGLTEEGLPYLAMEFVEGEPIDRSCETRGSDLRQRILKLIEVAEVVDFAHRNLVVHRDLKPSNILVDTEDRVKLLDFGVARIVDETAPGADLTQTQLAPVTPSCAAPEQLTGGAITTATDVWALGVLLYRLLTGEHPFDLDGTPHEITQRIIDDEPIAPSMRVGTERGRRLKGDLDNIVALALTKDPRQRYGTVDRLINDLRAYLEGRPVSAHAPSWSYRARKSIARHRRSLSVAAAIVVMIAGLTAFYTWRVTTERDRALAEQRKTEQVKSFVISLFSSNDPLESQGEEITAREMLDRGSPRIEEELADQPEIAAEMHQVVGSLYSMLGAYPAARENLERSALLSRESLGPQSLLLAQSLDQLANVQREEDDLDGAIESLREALSIRRAQPEDELGRAQTLNELGLTLAYRGDYEEAERLLSESYGLMQETLGEVNARTATVLNNLGLAIKWNGDFDRAEPIYRRVLEIRRVDPGELSPEYAISLDNLGVLLGQRGDYEESEQLFREALRIRHQLFGEEHPDVAMNLNNLATLFRVQGRLDQAEPMYRQVLALNRRLHGPRHRTVATNLHNLGSLLVGRGNYAAADSSFTEALAIRREVLGPAHIEVAMNQTSLVNVLVHLGDLERADTLSREAVEIGRAAVGNESFQLAAILNMRGQVLTDRQEFDQARVVLEEALQMRRGSLTDDHWEIGASAALLGECMAKQLDARGQRGESTEIESLLVEGYDNLFAARGAEFEATERARSVLFDYYTRHGQIDAAQRYAEAGEER